MDCLNCLHTAIEWVALYLIAKFVFSIWKLVYTYLLGSTPNFSKYGDWSVITGGTDGIGLAFAKKLASKGQNIVLISRSVDKLNAVASEIEESYKVKTRTISADFSDPSIYANIAKELDGLDIGVLVNNVGVSYEFPEFFLDVNPVKIQQLLTVNMQSVVEMTRTVMPGMVKKGKGVILNISSGSAVQPTPLMALYSATKQFVDCFSKSLNSEYASKGVIVQCVMPLFVTTKLSKIRKPSLFVPTPEKYVSSTLKTIGRARRSFGYLPHAIQGAVFGLVPESLYMILACQMHLPIRAKALKKLAASQKGK